MSTNEIKAGETVIINSGSPLMTVETVVDGRVHCVFMTEDRPGEVLRDVFPGACLTKHEGKTP